MAYLDTERSLYEIEVALAKHFEYLKSNIVVFNVIGESYDIPINHECDCLVISKAGYLTEIEIKRSWSDFLNDFKKRHKVKEPSIKYFYYCVPEKLRDKVYDRLDEEVNKNEGFNYSGVITYDEDLNLVQGGKRIKSWKRIGDYDYVDCALGWQKLYLEQKLAIARLGCIKTIKEKKKIVELQKGMPEPDQEEQTEEIIIDERKEESLF